MNELGIVVAPNGEYRSFGEWMKRDLRSIANETHWHTNSFMNQIYPTSWFQDLNIPYNKSKEFHTQLDVFAKSGCVIIVNSREDSSTCGESRFIITAPDSITDEQINFFIDKKKEFIDFGADYYSFIDILDTNEEYEIIQSFYNIVNYYEYLEEILQNRNQVKF